ncbi:MAG TPA: hypothetical protein VLS87_03700 [Woeseiaceae bacterium]|nr:hypothetical protein [Woeseiaceae bacterium]
MNIRKSTTALGTAIAMLTIGTSASAEHFCPTQFQIAEDLKNLAAEIRCVDDNSAESPGTWEGPAVWARGKNESCADHATAADALYVLSAPRGNASKDVKIRGAAAAVEQDEFEEAVRDLEGFTLDLLNNDLNLEFGEKDGKTAGEWTQDWINRAKAAQACVMEYIL